MTFRGKKNNTLLFDVCVLGLHDPSVLINMWKVGDFSLRVKWHTQVSDVGVQQDRKFNRKEKVQGSNTTSSSGLAQVTGENSFSVLNLFCLFSQLKSATSKLCIKDVSWHFYVVMCWICANFAFFSAASSHMVSEVRNRGENISLYFFNVGLGSSWHAAGDRER